MQFVITAVSSLGQYGNCAEHTNLFCMGSSAGGCTIAASPAAGSSLATNGLAALDGTAAALAAAAAAGAAGKRLTDTYVLDMFTGPTWEQLDDGAWSSQVVWLKQVWCSANRNLVARATGLRVQLLAQYYWRMDTGSIITVELCRNKQWLR